MPKKSRKKTPPPDYKPGAVFPPKKDSPSGGKWVVIGVILSVVGVVGYYTWGAAHHHAEGSVVAAPTKEHAKPANNKPASATDGSAAKSEPTPNTVSATSTSFDFYRMLPGMKVGDPQSVEASKPIGKEGSHAVGAEATKPTPPKDPPKPRTQEAAQKVPPVAVNPVTVNPVTVNPTVASPAAASTPSKGSPPSIAGVVYMLQAGAFRTSQDADRLRARLALMGITSTIQRMVGADPSEVWHKVRLGPFQDMGQASQVQERLRQVGIPSTLSREHHG